MNTQALVIGQRELEQLQTLRLATKFIPEALYPGAPNEEIRVDAENHVNALLDGLAAGLTANPTKEFVMSEFRAALSGFTQPDTEERERFCGYLEEIMDITGIESSDGLLNEWLYGFDPLNP